MYAAREETDGDFFATKKPFRSNFCHSFATFFCMFLSPSKQTFPEMEEKNKICVVFFAFCCCC